MILPITGFFLLSVYLLHFASSSDSVFDLFFDQTETRKARSSALHVTLTTMVVEELAAQIDGGLTTFC